MTSITVVNDGLNVVVTWAEPVTNNSPILEYLVEVRQIDEEFSSPSECPGTDPNIRICTIPMTTLRTAPYSLEYG